MNNARRKQIKEVERDIKYIIDKIQIIKTKLERVYDSEQDAFDSMPENLQYSRNGENSEMAIDSMSDAIDNLDDAIDNLSDIF
jgi:hypothetical protein